MRLRPLRFLWALAGVLGLLVLAKLKLGDVYRVGSGSMRPTIFGGVEPRSKTEFSERVFVRYGGAEDLERFDLVVLRLGAGTPPMVKRVAGLPGESVGVRHGDLVVDGALLAPGAPRPSPVPVFDDEHLELRRFFEFRDAPTGPWSFENDAWRLDAAHIPHGSDAGMMLFHKDLRDDYLDQHHQRVVGRFEANDAILSLEARLERLVGTLRLRLVEAGDTFEALIEAQTDGRVFAILTRFNAETLQQQDVFRYKVEVLARAEIDFAPGVWQRLRFSNVDNALTLEIGQQGLVLQAQYEANAPPNRTHDGRQILGARVALGGEMCRAGFRAIRVMRDLFYTSTGVYGIDQPITLGPDEFFLLGDNSAQSQDSRFFGPVRADQILGRPVWVVWPPGRVRPLRGAVGPVETDFTPQESGTSADTDG